MSVWQPLPDGLPPEVRHFVEQLRLLKDRTGLSLVPRDRTVPSGMHGSWGHPRGPDRLPFLCVCARCVDVLTSSRISCESAQRQG